MLVTLASGKCLQLFANLITRKTTKNRLSFCHHLETLLHLFIKYFTESLLWQSSAFSSVLKLVWHKAQVTALGKRIKPNIEAAPVHWLAPKVKQKLSTRQESGPKTSASSGGARPACTPAPSTSPWVDSNGSGAVAVPTATRQKSARRAREKKAAQAREDPLFC